MPLSQRHPGDTFRTVPRLFYAKDTMMKNGRRDMVHANVPDTVGNCITGYSITQVSYKLSSYKQSRISANVELFKLSNSYITCALDCNIIVLYGQIQ